MGKTLVSNRDHHITKAPHLHAQSPHWTPCNASPKRQLQVATVSCASMYPAQRDNFKRPQYHVHLCTRPKETTSSGLSIMCIYVPGPEAYVLSLPLFQSHHIKSWQGKPQFSLRRSKISSTPVLWHVRQNRVYEKHPPQWCCGKTGLLAGATFGMRPSLSRNIIIPNSVTQNVILSLLVMVHTMRICKLIFTSNVFSFF